MTTEDEIGLPNWRNNVIERVRLRDQSKPHAVTKRRGVALQTFVDPPFLGAVRQAAQARGIGVGAYMRRSVAKQVAKDLGLDWRVLLRGTPAALPWGERHKPNTPAAYDDGQGFGNWDN